jgi:hypothetical protein
MPESALERFAERISVAVSLGVLKVVDRPEGVKTLESQGRGPVILVHTQNSTIQSEKPICVSYVTAKLTLGRSSNGCFAPRSGHTLQVSFSPLADIVVLSAFGAHRELGPVFSWGIPKSIIE